MKYIPKNPKTYEIWNGVRYLGKFHKLGTIWLFIAPSVKQPIYQSELLILHRDLVTLNEVGEI
jgi:hypothetical protein